MYSSQGALGQDTPHALLAKGQISLSRQQPLPTQRRCCRCICSVAPCCTLGHSPLTHTTLICKDGAAGAALKGACFEVRAAPLQHLQAMAGCVLNGAGLHVRIGPRVQEHGCGREGVVFVSTGLARGCWGGGGAHSTIQIIAYAMQNYRLITPGGPPSDKIPQWRLQRQKLGTGAQAWGQPLKGRRSAGMGRGKKNHEG